MSQDVRGTESAEVSSPEFSRLTPQAAKALLSIKFSRRQQDRITKLLEINREAKLSRRDRKELVHVLQVGSLLAILQSTARLRLKRLGATRSRKSARSL